ncbi:winged helix-turn-helix transcriptional regulator [Paremcibacter congregatus]|uniref:winged helix-turn-helix transcriptional regulator n=1 Tax=Paremcibacter congregatus TaxID=2043170 RepID=UPI003A9321D9
MYEIKDDDTRLAGLRSSCPISIALDVVGDKWTLIILRDLLMGKTRYKQFQESPEKIPTSILADRLKRLEKLDFLEKRLYQEKPKRYEYFIRERGRDMIPVLHEISRWSVKHAADCLQPPERFWDLKP